MTRRPAGFGFRVASAASGFSPPTYPQYAALLADARAAAAAAKFVDPAALARLRSLNRDWDWRVSVLGYFGDGTATLEEMYLLLLADERDLKPPLPQWLADKRADDDAADLLRQQARQWRADQDQLAWDIILKALRVEVVVRRNGTARPRYGYVHHLGHAVPAVDAFSGPARSPRRHPAGRGLCESETRKKPLDLSGGEGGPVTCVRCLALAVKVRPAA